MCLSLKLHFKMRKGNQGHPRAGMSDLGEKNEMLNTGGHFN